MDQALPSTTQTQTNVNLNPGKRQNFRTTRLGLTVLKTGMQLHFWPQSQGFWSHPDYNCSCISGIYSQFPKTSKIAPMTATTI